MGVRGRRAQRASVWEEGPISDPDVRECRADVGSRSGPQGCGGGCGKDGRARERCPWWFGKESNRWSDGE